MTAASATTPRRIGVAADHGGYGLKEPMAAMLREAGYTVVDFGDGQLTADDDYPDFVVPMARAVVCGEIVSDARRGVMDRWPPAGAIYPRGTTLGSRAAAIPAQEPAR